MLFLQQHARFHFPSPAAHKASSAWFVNGLRQGGKQGNRQVVFFVFFFLLLNLLSAYHSDIAAAQTHDNDFDGRVVKRPRPRCGAQVAFFALLGATSLTNACGALRLERAPRARLISPKTT